MIYQLQPAILEDESILGYLQRFAVVANHSSFKPLIRSVLPLKGIQAPWTLPSSLDRLSQNLDVLPSGRQLLLNHTIFRSVTAFLQRDIKEQIALQMTIEAPIQGRYFALGLNHSLGKSRQATQNFCPSCVHECIAKHGHSYWSRIHQFPYISTCGRHGDVLMTGSECCGITKRTSSFSHLPGRACNCKSPYVSVSVQSSDSLYMQRDKAISKLLVDGLSTSWPEMTPGEVNLLYRHAASQRGFMRGSYIDSIGLSDAFRVFYGVEFLENYASNCASETGWIAEAFRGGIPKSAVRNALIIHFLFKDLNGFLEQWHANEWKSAVLPTRRSADSTVRETITSTDSVTKSRMRALLLAWKSGAENPTRTNAQKAQATAVNWVRANDWDWYEENFPIVPRTKIAAAQTKFWAERQEQAEREAIKHVERRYKEIMESTSMPVRITRQILRRGLARPFSQLPKTLEVVNALLESKLAFNKRKAVWLYLNPSPNMFGQDLLQLAYQKTRIPKGQIRELLRELDVDARNK